MPTMLTTSQLKALLREHSVRLTKRRGQHHLVDRRVVERLIERCELSPDDTVVDIGAGLGALTEPLAQRAGHVIAVEVDKRICELLRTRMMAWPQVRVVCQDILEFSWEQLGPTIVVGAIPYSITSPILLSLYQQRRTIRRALLIIQREVAQRLLATPGTKAYGRLSVLGQYGWHITPVMSVPRSAFFPQPDVDSTCLRLSPRSRPVVAVEREPAFFEMVKAAFAHRRKSFVNCMKAYGGGAVSRSQVETLVQAIGLPRSVRGEELSLDQFARLSSSLLREGLTFDGSRGK